jgi:hypothetical protein
MRVRNQDPVGHAGFPRAVYGCQGWVFLEGLAGPPGQ